MIEHWRNNAGRLIRTFCERLIHDLHNFGVALVPALCERMIWVAILSIAVFMALVAIQTLMTET